MIFQIFILSITILKFTDPAIAAADISNTGLIDYIEYMRNVMQTFIYDLEDDGICKLGLRDFKLDINQTIYTLNVIGNVDFKNGFAAGIGSAAIKQDQITQYLNNEKKTTSVHCILMFSQIKLVYDIEASFTNSEQKATGIYVLKDLEYDIYVIKDLNTNEISVDFDRMPTIANDQKIRIRFLPKNEYTDVIARNFNATINEFRSSFTDWSISLKTIMENVVKNKIPFPEISYETSLNT